MAPNSDNSIDDTLQITSSDLLATKLVTNIFEGTGFSGWKRGMEIALSAKNKKGFIDGTITKPAATSETAKAWQRCNDMVFSWILNSLSGEIVGSILYCDSAKSAWQELCERYGQSNGAQLYGIHKRLSEFSQGSDNVARYFTKLKLLWDEIDAMGVNPNCSCSCTCGASEKQRKFQQDQRVVQFLMGLNESYNVIRGTILMQNPLPSVASVYNNLIQEEKQREIQNAGHFNAESSSLYAKNTKTIGYQHYSKPDYKGKGPVTDTRRDISCNYCKKPGHTIDRCYKLQYNRSRKFANNAQTDGILGSYDHHVGAVDRNMSSSTPDITPDMLEQLRNILQNQSQSSQILPSAANFAGNIFLSLGSSASINFWILDSGASDHMCADKKLFSNMQPILKPYNVSLPNGESVRITQMGSVPVTTEITLQNVLYVPCFKFNLLSIAKLATAQCHNQFYTTFLLRAGLFSEEAAGTW
ncbi:hypothetical protein RND81_12G100400 [Saponaria officinalis]|uniref:Retrotransposon Copia-like N-terminal domain-containing protein n=1 Tax=Saponaria officinalis TaxID=3572 RepID=A0AAW1H8Q4_SAPOF